MSEIQGYQFGQLQPISQNRKPVNAHDRRELNAEEKTIDQFFGLTSQQLLTRPTMYTTTQTLFPLNLFTSYKTVGENLAMALNLKKPGHEVYILCRSQGNPVDTVIKLTDGHMTIKTLKAQETQEFHWSLDEQKPLLNQKPIPQSAAEFFGRLNSQGTAKIVLTYDFDKQETRPLPTLANRLGPPPGMIAQAT